MFVTTANTLNIPPPLLDRMEVIRIAGYTEEEKAEIARTHLIPSAIKKHGWSRRSGRSPTRSAHADPALHARGGRAHLERELSNLIRKTVKEILLKKVESVVIDDAKLAEFLGPAEVPLRRGRDGGHGGRRHRPRLDGGRRRASDDRRRAPPRQGRMTVTGNLKDVMKESISAAASYVRSRAIRPRRGTAALRAQGHPRPRAGGGDAEGRSVGRHCHGDRIISVATGIPVPPRRRHDRRGDARGSVLPDRRLKEKLLAALRGGIKKVLIPRRTPRISSTSRRA
jgi:ATP-dependent Lon protease